MVSAGCDTIAQKTTNNNYTLLNINELWYLNNIWSQFPVYHHIKNLPPAMYPAANVTTSCSLLLHSALGLGTTCWYNNSTVRSKQANFIMVYGICLPHNGGRDL